jgi:outer membrane protein assembly factor BamB
MSVRVARLALVLAGALFPVAASADPLTLERSFLNPSPNANDLFGISVSLSEGKALIGAELDGTTGSGSGRAYIFDAANGVLLHTLENPTPATNDFFGLRVSLAGNLALVGAQNNDVTGASNSGAAYLFDATTGALLRTFLNPGPAPIASDNFGIAVSLFGDRALISAINDDVGASNAGAAYLFNTTTGALLRTFTNPTPASGDNFGFDVALFGDRALISTINDDTAALNAGAAYLFDTNTGMLLQTFLNPTPELNNTFGNNDLFGFDIALSSTRALIGAVNENVNGFHNGAAYLYDVATGTLLDTLLIPTPSSDTEEFLGEGVALSDDYALVGAAFRNHGLFPMALRDRGAAFLFDANTGAFLQEIRDPQPDRGDRFGKAVALDGQDALIGAQTDFINLISSGQVFYYAGPAVVPEPGTLAVLMFGLAGLFVVRGRRKITR